MQYEEKVQINVLIPKSKLEKNIMEQIKFLFKVENEKICKEKFVDI